jgi:hypothetical protein
VAVGLFRERCLDALLKERCLGAITGSPCSESGRLHGFGSQIPQCNQLLTTATVCCRL